MTNVQDAVNKIVDEAIANVYAEGLVGVHNDIHISVRVGRRLIHNKRVVDLMQIGWAPFVFEGTPLSSKPKGSAVQVWKALENKAKDLNFVLRIESILTEELHSHLMRTRKYKPDPNDPSSLLYSV
ncbi:MAG: hypothetical protein ACTSUE_07715 [Promethearchaeota archaeon]